MARHSPRRLLLVLILVLSRLAVGRADPLATGGPIPPSSNPCVDPGTTSRLFDLLSAGRWVDAHHAAAALQVLCGGVPEVARWDLVDALALLRLEDTLRARQLLLALEDAPESALARRATTILAWSYLNSRDRQAFSSVLSRVEPSARNRLLALDALDDPSRLDARLAALDPALGAKVGALVTARRAVGTKHPWVAGVMSALLPGAGQAYAGSPAGAAVALVLNAVLIGATVELFDRELYLGAATTGLAASVFYMGGIFNAVDLVRRRNEMALMPAREQLEQALVPEVWGRGP